MVKMVLKDFYARRWEALKSSLFHAIMSFIYIIFLCNPYAGAGEMTLTERIVNGIQLFMLFLMMLIHAMYPNNLSSVMFFVPIEQKDRKMYLYTAYGIKVIGSTVIHGICNSILVFMGQMVWWRAILLVVSLLLWNLVAGIGNFKFGDQMLQPYLDKMKSYDYRMVFSYFLFLVCFEVVICVDGTEQTGDLVLIVALVILQILVCIWTLKKDFHFYMEQGITYEVVKKRNQKQRGKQHG